MQLKYLNFFSCYSNYTITISAKEVQIFYLAKAENKTKTDMLKQVP